MNDDTTPALAADAATGNVVAALTDIWEKVLETRGITPQQDFFDLGGNSVLMIAMLELVQRDLGREVDIGKLVDMGATGVTVESVAGLLS